ncbi:MAG: nucleotidyltransferase domain-containing protein [Candidatus Hydrogenedentes bacterium]|nr:nucleotidyltransferase domain-containing protein [Candidatus Hydrogenedentota bacterium]MBI3117327.1 nucleotidyltransferase domain-containing protein [Candidatus Hydrogenedentota bacterium]
MAETAIIETVKKYLAALPPRGIHSRRAVLYGSHAKGTANEWSDIDLIVLAPEFDGGRPQKKVRELWLARRDADAPIEPIPCGEREWETDDSRPILEIARREGIEISI